MATAHDMVIRGGEVFDGTGAPAAALDVAIAGDRIAALLPPGAPSDAPSVIDASGHCVCPGFIDVHSHSDTYLLIEPSAASKLFQGVTTEITGQCGASGAPLFGEYHMPSDWASQQYPRAWQSVAELRELFEEVCPALNMTMLAGHSALRAGAMGYAARAARPDEQQTMIRQLEQALDEGARGFSTGLVYTPGRYSTPSEVHALARVVARHDGVYASHMRSEGKGLHAAVDETLAVARECGVRTQVSHLKASGPAHWHLLDGAIERIETARSEGIPVAADRYPYTAGGTDLDILFPEWAAAGGRAAVMARLEQDSARACIAAELDAERDAGYWETVRVGGTWHASTHDCRGRTIAEIAAQRGCSPGTTVVSIVHADALRTGAFFFGMDPGNMQRVLALPWVMIGSDASLRAPWPPLNADHPHPRAYGTFPRFIRMVLDGKTVSLPEAIRRMTSWPAEHFGLSRRGRLARGAAADVVVWHSETIRDRATYARPHQLACGVRDVIVNGIPALRDGALTGRRAGQWLS